MVGPVATFRTTNTKKIVVMPSRPKDWIAVPAGIVEPSVACVGNRSLRTQGQKEIDALGQESVEPRIASDFLDDSRSQRMNPLAGLRPGASDLEAAAFIRVPFVPTRRGW